ncbi:hypothetical protein QBC40DRAFT_36701 [Triangularia verruculosa]|uniref:Uncharacterized protein n=1 Tax=Triangularia verruculosa TaxID=2587418 RepID=A0AAN6XU28_9PEZI|nr:hypothetical protein QBC40DRAFT_36701 [Triangularia verruculosa]
MGFFLGQPVESSPNISSDTRDDIDGSHRSGVSQCSCTRPVGSTRATSSRGSVPGDRLLLRSRRTKEISEGRVGFPLSTGRASKGLSSDMGTPQSCCKFPFPVFTARKMAQSTSRSIMIRSPSLPNNMSSWEILPKPTFPDQMLGSTDETSECCTAGFSLLTRRDRMFDGREVLHSPTLSSRPWSDSAANWSGRRQHARTLSFVIKMEVGFPTTL